MMNCTVEIVVCEVPKIRQESQIPQYCIRVKTKDQQAPQQEQGGQPVGVSNLVFLQSDKHIEE